MVAATAEEGFKAALADYLRRKADYAAEAPVDDAREATYQDRLRAVIARLEENFPRKPKPAESYYLFEAYRSVHPDRMSDDDRKNWLRHTKRFMNATKEGKIAVRDSTFDAILSSLPDMGGSLRETFEYSLDAFKRLPNGSASKRRWRPEMERRADGYFDGLMREEGAAAGGKEKMSACKRAVKIVEYMSPQRRVGSHLECFDRMRPLAEGAPGLEINLEHLRKVHRDRIYKGLPHDMKNEYARRRENLR